MSLSFRKCLYAFLLSICYSVLVFLIQIGGNKLGVFNLTPDTTSLVQWDAAWYKSIADKGYVYWSWGGCNAGFFILFPLLWKTLHLSVIGVVILNILLFSGGFAILTSTFSIDLKAQLLFLSLPPLYCMFVPYTEALSFFLIAVAMYGIYKQKAPWVVSALFLLALTRASIVFLVPAFLCMEIIGNEKKNVLSGIKRYVLLYIVPSIAGLALFVIYQYQKIGIWFVYFQQQREFWGRKFSIPAFPFSKENTVTIFLLSAICVFIGCCALLFLAWAFICWLLNGRQYDKLLIASVAYVVASLLVIIFFNPKGEGTKVVGIARYTVCTPFFFYLLQWWYKNRSYKLIHFISIATFANVVWLLFGAYMSWEKLLLFNIGTAVILFWMLHVSRKSIVTIALIILINIITQAYLFQDFLTGSFYPD